MTSDSELTSSDIKEQASFIALPEMIRLRTAAEFLDLSYEKVRQMLKKGELAHVRFGSNYRIPKSVLAQYLEDNLCHAHSKAHASCASTEKQTGTSGTDAASSLQQERRIGRALNAH